MRRREFITGLSAVAWPLAARAEQVERVRRVGVLMFLPEGSERQVRIAKFLQGLRELGWTVGRNLSIDYRWTAGDDDLRRRYAKELVTLAPDVVLVSGGSHVAAMQQAGRTIPIVFVGVVDPVGGGYVANLARPGRNATGFSDFEYGMGAKWLELLNQVAPRVARVAVLRDPAITSGTGQFAAIQAVAPSLGVELSPLDVRDAGEIERALTTFVRGPNDGLIVVANPTASVHSDVIVALAARKQLPAIYPYRSFVTVGGLISYGPDQVDQFHSAASYFDRILKGEKPADLPVQAPTRYETVLNLKTGKALGLTIPETLLATADEVIQ